MITIHNNMKIYHNHLQVLCVRCIKTGNSNLRLRSDFSPIIKHAQAKRVLFIEWLKTVVVLFSCVLMNIIAVGYTVLWSV